MLGTFALSAGYSDQYYERARGVLAALRRQVDDALAVVDVLVTPTSPTAAFALGEHVDDPLAMYLSDIFTAPANLVGLPAVAVPSGFDEGLPLSLQIMGRPFDEATVFCGSPGRSRTQVVRRACQVRGRCAERATGSIGRRSAVRAPSWRLARLAR